MVEEGNAVLRGIGYEIQAAQEQLDTLRLEIAEYEARTTEYAFRLAQTQSQMIVITEIQQSRQLPRLVL